MCASYLHWGIPKLLNPTKKPNLSLCVGDIHARCQLLKNLRSQRPQRSHLLLDTEIHGTNALWNPYGLYGFTLFVFTLW